MAKDDQNKDAKQEPELQKKKEGGMKLPVLIALILGILIVNAVLIVVLFNMMVAPNLKSDGGEETKKAKVEHKEDEGGTGEESKTPSEFIASGRITTNPRGSDRFVVVDLAFEFTKKEGAEEGESHGGEKGGFSPKMLALIKGSVNKSIGMMTVEDIQASRDTLDKIFFTSMKPIFKKDHKTLKQVIIQEFILQ